MNREVLRAYATPLMLMVVMGLCAWGLDNPANVIFLKVLFAPIDVLATRGLRAHFPESLDGVRSSATQCEYIVLDSFLLTAFIMVLNWKGDQSVWWLITISLVVAVTMAALRIVTFILGKRRAGFSSM